MQRTLQSEVEARSTADTSGSQGVREVASDTGGGRASVRRRWCLPKGVRWHVIVLPNAAGGPGAVFIFALQEKTAAVVVVLAEDAESSYVLMECHLHQEQASPARW